MPFGRWLKPTRESRRPGSPGVRVCIIDVSASVEGCANVFRDEIAKLRDLPQNKDLRVIEFDTHAVVWQRCGSYRGPMEANGVWDSSDPEPALRLARGMKPVDTYVLSDGCIPSTRVSLCLDHVAAMTGNVHAFHAYGYLPRSSVEDRGVTFMQDIARTGNGEFQSVTPETFGRILRGALGQKEEMPLADKRQMPDVYLDGGDELNFVLPDDVVVDGRQHVKLLRGTVIQEEWVPPEWLPAIGAPSRQNVQMGGAQVNVQESGNVQKVGFGRRLAALFAPQPQQAAIPQQHQTPYQTVQDRGQIVDASYEAVQAPAVPALPSPQRNSAPALPAPQRSSGAPQLAHQPEMPMPVMPGVRRPVYIPED